MTVLREAARVRSVMSLWRYKSETKPTVDGPHAFPSEILHRSLRDEVNVGRLLTRFANRPPILHRRSFGSIRLLNQLSYLLEATLGIRQFRTNIVAEALEHVVGDLLEQVVHL